MDGGAWWAAVHGVAKSQTRLSDFTFTFHFLALEKEMATHSSVLGLENPRDRGAWWVAISGVAQSRTRLKRLSSSSSNSLRQVFSEWEIEPTVGLATEEKQPQHKIRFLKSVMFSSPHQIISLIFLVSLII